MRLFTLRIVGLLLFALLTACSSYKNIPYFQDLNRTAPSKEDITNFSPLKIQPGDILGIHVNSLNPEASALFNYNMNRMAGPSNEFFYNNPVVGFLVDVNGEINLPLIGTVKVSGLTTTEIQNNLTAQLVTFLKKPVINVRILNFRVSVLGDVQNPNVYTVQNERITITDALSLAGDLNITAMRNNVLLIREIDGSREYYPIDLTSKKLMESPYFYLRNNDVLYVQPDKSKFATVNRGYQNANLVFSAVSALSILLTIFLR
ncbi:polysaccharide export protein [Adhaeribacter swui]|uniref:Polysaccharide export protein n=1 Tax=Adhaeribacter swui TaxID=2086471 RepID=A0A7G7G5A2_9BACT|nr:polysaccharide biosynthesis/export family protein [Adhaeribacter swui]QNF32336.1 polysaccharide export protein [Adhaeribacter swui]